MAENSDETRAFVRPEDILGRTIASHRVVEKIGEGGMGLVFKAVDTRLDRTVALKVINPLALVDTEARSRFLREAKAAAAINHPNICTLFEANEAEGLFFMSMEFIEGPSLRSKIDERPLPLEEALDIAVQVGEGLRASHQKGIVHRDIKPGNILLDADKRAKILDFGLAQMLRVSQLTIPGTVMGTPAYMSPEQLKGEDVDERSDIWSLGVVLYEMLSGRLPFRSQSGQGLGHQILQQEPEPLTALRSGLPIELDHIVGKAMAKNPAERYQHVAEMLVDLRVLKKRLPNLADSPPSSFALQRAKQRRFPKYVPWAAALALILAAAALWKPWKSRTPAAADPQLIHFVVSLPEGDSFQGVGIGGSAIDLSPDGQTVVYSARRGNVRQLFRRTLSDPEPFPIPDTQGAIVPILNHDQSWITFASGREVKRVHSQSGGSTVLGSADVVDPLFNVDVAYFGGCWINDNDLLVGECTRGLRLFSLSSGKKKEISDVFLSPKDTERQHQYPQILPGGRWVLFTVWNSPQDSSIAVRSLETGEQRILLKPGSYARYSPSGHIVYAWQGDLFAAPFDLDGLQTTGPPVKVIEGVMMQEQRGAAHFSLSENGSLAYIPGPYLTSTQHLCWVDLQGRVQELDFPSPDRGVRLSPDGKKALVGRFTDAGPNQEIWVYELERGISRPLTDQKSDSYWPVWDPEGDRAIYLSSQNMLKNANVYMTAVDGSHQEQEIPSTDGPWNIPYSLDREGKSMALMKGRDASFEIWLVPLQGGTPPYPVCQGQSLYIHPALSPDGRWLAYASDESGRFEVKVRLASGKGFVYQVTSEGGWEPAWSPDGKILYFRSMDGKKMMAADFAQGASPTIGKPRLLFEAENLVRGMIFGRNYDVSSDGRRFLMISYTSPPPPPKEYHVIVNWAKELELLTAGR